LSFGRISFKVLEDLLLESRLEALRMEIEYRFNIKQIPNMENSSERILAKYYS
jgi:hypothetical protein